MAQATASRFGAAMLEVAAREVGQAESGANNRGPKVDVYQRADDLPGEGYAWCASFVAWVAEQVYGRDFPVTGEAAVASWLTWGRRNGHVVTRPFAGDLVCFRFTSADKVDHIGIVEKVLALGPVLRIRTIEGNTGTSGAVSDPGTGRDAVHRKVRVVTRGSVEFVRIPDSYLVPPPPAKKPTRPKPAARFHVYAKGKQVASRKTPLQIAKALDKLTRAHGDLTVRRAK